MMPRRRLHRCVFVLAGLYNLAWGAYSIADPQWLFRFADMPPINYPEIFACLGMVIGLYGVIYLEVARRPEHGWLLAAVGLAGKVFGPIGLLMLLVRGTWPIASSILCVTNDLIWWLPFTLYLIDAWTARNAVLIAHEGQARSRIAAGARIAAPRRCSQRAAGAPSITR